MSGRALKFLFEVRDVVGATALLAAINLSQVNVVVSITAGLITIAYTVWRWRRAAKHSRKEND